VTRLARAFVAVVPPDAVLDALHGQLASLTDEPSPLRWVPRHQQHLTLTFLGRVDDADALTDALASATLAVARKLVAYLVAIDRSQRDFLVVEKENCAAA